MKKPKQRIKPVLPKPSINRIIQHRLAEKDFINKPPIRFKDNAEKYGFKKEDAINFKIGQFTKIKDLIN